MRNIIRKQCWWFKGGGTSPTLILVSHACDLLSHLQSPECLSITYNVNMWLEHVNKLLFQGRVPSKRLPAGLREKWFHLFQPDLLSNKKVSFLATITQFWKQFTSCFFLFDEDAEKHIISVSLLPDPLQTFTFLPAVFPPAFHQINANALKDLDE